MTTTQKSEDERINVLNSEYLYCLYPEKKGEKVKIGSTKKELSTSLRAIREIVKSYKNKPVIMSDWEHGKFMNKKEVLEILDRRIKEEETMVITISLKNDRMDIKEAEALIRLVKDRTEIIQVVDIDGNIFMELEYIEDDDFYYCEIYGIKVSTDFYFNINNISIWANYVGKRYLKMADTRVDLEE